MKRYLQLRSKRAESGSAISEVPPALFLLVFCAVLPLINLIFFGLIFASCVMLNNLEISEASRTPNSEVAASLNSLQDQWKNTGLGRLAVGSTAPSSDVSYSMVGTDTYVNVATTFTVKPVLSVPFFQGIPALGAPWSFTIFGKRVLENASYANP